MLHMRNSQFECQLTCFVFLHHLLLVLLLPEMSLQIMSKDFQEKESNEKNPNKLQNPLYKWVINS